MLCRCVVAKAEKKPIVNTCLHGSENFNIGKQDRAATADTIVSAPALNSLYSFINKEELHMCKAKAAACVMLHDNEEKASCWWCWRPTCGLAIQLK